MSAHSPYSGRLEDKRLGVVQRSAAYSFRLSWWRSCQLRAHKADQFLLEAYSEECLPWLLCNPQRKSWQDTRYVLRYHWSSSRAGLFVPTSPRSAVSIIGRGLKRHAFFSKPNNSLKTLIGRKVWDAEVFTHLQVKNDVQRLRGLMLSTINVHLFRDSLAFLLISWINPFKCLFAFKRGVDLSANSIGFSRFGR